MPEELKKDASFTADQELPALAEAREKWIRNYNTGMEAAREHALKMLRDGLPLKEVRILSKESL